MASWKEYVYADVNQQSTLDFSGDFARDHLSFLDLLNDLFPLFDDLSPFLADLNAAHLVFDVLNQDFDGIAGLRRFFFLAPLGERNSAFALKADIDKYHFAVDLNHAARHYLVDIKIDRFIVFD